MVVGWLGLGIWMLISICIHVFYIKRINFTKQPIINPVLVYDGAQLRIQIAGSLFRRGADEMRPLGSRSPLDTLADYLLKHPNRTVLITGYYTQAESQMSVVPNLGSVRAGVIEQYLQAVGVPKSVIKTKGIQSEGLLFVHDSTNALSFSFEPTAATAQSLAERQKYINLFQPLALYFPTGSAAFIRTMANQQFVRDAVTYLRVHKKARLVIEGHTDSVGSAALNLRLSRKRAVSVRDTFLTIRLPASRFRIVARGESQPIAPNSTSEGREANRRVTVAVAPK